jgi:hypothetical protein
MHPLGWILLGNLLNLKLARDYWTVTIQPSISHRRRSCLSEVELAIIKDAEGRMRQAEDACRCCCQLMGMVYLFR